MKIEQLREDRTRLARELKDLVDKAEREERRLSGEEQTRVDELLGKIRDIDGEIKRLEEAKRELAHLEEPEPRQVPDPAASGERSQEQAGNVVRVAFDKFIRFGFSALAPEERQALVSLHRDLPAEATRALAAGTDASGGYTVPDEMQRQIETAMAAYGGLFKAVDVIDTDSGRDIPWPTSNDTSNKGARVAENAEVGVQDVTFGSVTIRAHMYTSNIIKASLQFLQDTAINAETWLADRMAERIGRIVNEECTTGDGSGKPNGIVNAAYNSGVTFTAGSITYDNLVDIKHAVNAAYRQNPGCAWMFSDDVLKIVEKLKDSNGRPIWMPSPRDGVPDKILGFPFYVNDDVPAPDTSGNKAILFGDLKKYKLRRVRGIQILRLTERYAEFLQVGFLGFMRADGQLIDAGTHPVVYAAVA